MTLYVSMYRNVWHKYEMYRLAINPTEASPEKQWNTERKRNCYFIKFIDKEHIPQTIWDKAQFVTCYKLQLSCFVDCQYLIRKIITDNETGDHWSMSYILVLKKQRIKTF